MTEHDYGINVEQGPVKGDVGYGAIMTDDEGAKPRTSEETANLGVKDYTRDAETGQQNNLEQHSDNGDQSTLLPGKISDTFVKYVLSKETLSEIARDSTFEDPSKLADAQIIYPSPRPQPGTVETVDATPYQPAQALQFDPHVLTQIAYQATPIDMQQALTKYAIVAHLQNDQEGQSLNESLESQLGTQPVTRNLDAMVHEPAGVPNPVARGDLSGNYTLDGSIPTITSELGVDAPRIEDLELVVSRYDQGAQRPYADLKPQVANYAGDKENLRPYLEQREINPIQDAPNLDMRMVEVETSGLIMPTSFNSIKYDPGTLDSALVEMFAPSIGARTETLDEAVLATNPAIHIQNSSLLGQYSPEHIMSSNEENRSQTLYRDVQGRVLEGVNVALDQMVQESDLNGSNTPQNYLELFVQLLNKSGYNVEIQTSSYFDFTLNQRVTGSILVNKDNPNIFYHLIVNGGLLEFKHGEESPYVLRGPQLGDYMKVVEHQRDLPEINSVEFDTKSKKQEQCDVKSERIMLNEGHEGMTYRDLADDFLRRMRYNQQEIQNIYDSGALRISSQTRIGEMGGLLPNLDQRVNVTNNVSVEIAIMNKMPLLNYMQHN